MGRAEDIVRARHQQDAADRDARVRAWQQSQQAMLPELHAKCQEFLALMDEKDYPDALVSGSREWNGELLLSWSLFKTSPDDGYEGLYMVSLLSTGEMIEEVFVSSRNRYELKPFPDAERSITGNVREAMEILDWKINRLRAM